MVEALKPTGDTPRDLLLLEQIPGVGPITVRRLVEHFGSARQALRARDDDFGGAAGKKATASRRDPAIERRVDTALETAQRSAMTILPWDHDAYPPALHRLVDPPPVLFLKGRTELLGSRASVTVVGARRATVRGRDLAQRLGAAVARSGAIVTSGLALGIDGAAHTGALQVGGDTIAVLGTGADVPYPRNHRRLFGRIAERGLLVTEFLPGVVAAPHHFPRRNRILAALAATVVVVEAGPRSGSLITVDHALDLGRDVWVVPGPIDTSVCEGSNRLLVDGASPLVSIQGFVDEVLGETGRPSGDAGGAVRTGGGGLEANLLAALAIEPMGPDELAALAGCPVHEVLASLTMLEVHGAVVRLPGMRYRRAA